MWMPQGAGLACSTLGSSQPLPKTPAPNHLPAPLVLHMTLSVLDPQSLPWVIEPCQHQPQVAARPPADHVSRGWG